MTDNAVASAVEKALPLIEASAAEYTRMRDCFSCHHQALPAVAVASARVAGRESDAEASAAQVDFTRSYFAARRE
ncbi:MAG: hypothetical protein KY476_23090, partial [Planctomycetes bacterium]|nr:hypothetical protein [Planctomycetota bacterium]